MTLTEAERLTTRKANPKRRSKMRRRAAIHVVQFLLLFALLAGWQLGVPDESVAYFSRPTLVAARLVALLSEAPIYRHIAITAIEIAIGYGLGAGVGLVLGFVLGRSPVLSATFQPFVIGLYSVPKIALAPVFIVWLGLGMASKVAVVFLSSFFLVFFNTYSGLLMVNEEIVNLARLMGASWRQVIFRVIVPSAASQIFLGLKTAVPYAVIGAVIGEYIGSNEGLGFFILYASQTYDAASLFAGIVILVAIVFAANAGLSWIERRVIRWKSASGSAVQI